MSSKVIGIIGPGGEGGTFLDWTLHYLAGDTYIKYVLVDRPNNKILSIRRHYVLFNPITLEGTAHKHHKAHPTEPLIKECIELYNSINDPEIHIHSMYIVPSTESYANGRSYREFSDQVVASYPDIKLIQFHYPNVLLEDLVNRIKFRMPNNTELISNIRHRVQTECEATDKTTNSVNSYPLDIADMFYSLDTKIRNIFEWLNLNIDETRYSNWLAVYKEWQLAQKFYTTIQ